MKALNQLKNKWDSLFSTSKKGDSPQKRLGESSKAQFALCLPIPRLNLKDIDLEVKDNYLIVSSSRAYSNQWIKESLKRAGTVYEYNSYRSVFLLPDFIDPNNLSISSKNDMLHITADVKGTSKKPAKKIAIN